MSTPKQLPIKIFARTAQRLGMDVGRWAPSREDIPMVASHEAIRPLLEHLQDQRPDEPLGVVIGRHCQPYDFGVPSLIGRHSPTLRQAVDRYIYFQTLAAPGCMRLETTDPGGTDVIVAPSPPLDATMAFHCVFPVAFAMQNLRRLADDGALGACSVGLMSPDDGFGAQYEAFFDAPVEFECPENTLELAAGELDREVVGADPAVVPYLERLVLQEAEQFGIRPGVNDDFGRLVRIKLRDAILQRDFELPAVARRLGMGQRTLQRRLNDEDLSFRVLVDEVRKELALELMRASEHTLQDIAFKLDYSHVASFSRAFKRWTGRTPGEYRQEMTFTG